MLNSFYTFVLGAFGSIVRKRAAKTCQFWS